MNIATEKNRKRVVIVGGGFAGLKLAQNIDDRIFQTVLLDKNNHHIFQPLLYQVATGGIEVSAISFPFRKIFRKKKHFHYRMCKALSVNPDKNQIITDIGSLDYDYLVLATGCDTNFFGNTSFKENCMGLKTSSEALYIRNHLLNSIEKAQNTSDLEEQKKLLTFVIVGGGATGVELAGALAEMRRFTFPHDYPEIDIARIKIVIVTNSQKLLPSFKDSSSLEATQYLEHRQVDIKLNTRVLDYSNQILQLSNGSIETANVFWTAGVIANSLPGFTENFYGKQNRLLVDEYNRVKGFNNIFAIGDTALMISEVWPNGHPQVAQVAIQQAVNTVYNLKQIENNSELKPFNYHDKGSMATIGRNHAVVELKHFKFGGFLGWIVWLLIHLIHILGIKNRILILMDWMWSYFTYDTGLRIIVHPISLDIDKATNDTQTKPEQ